MIESIMFFSAGFLLASLLGLALISSVHHRAVRLTQRRLEDAIPVSLTEIQADRDRLRAEFKVQFCQVTGGGCQYGGHSMAAAHKGLHLTNADFNALVEDLQSAMDTCGIAFATQNRFLARLAPYQHQVVTR